MYWPTRKFLPLFSPNDIDTLAPKIRMNLPFFYQSFTTRIDKKQLTWSPVIFRGSPYDL